MLALIIGIGIGGLIYAFATAKKDPWEESKNVGDEMCNGVDSEEDLDYYERELGGDIAIVDEVQSN